MKTISPTLPTELSRELKSNMIAGKIYRTLTETAKRSYITYVIAAQSVKERKCRAEHSVKMMLGKENTQHFSCV